MAQLRKFATRDRVSYRFEILSGEAIYEGLARLSDFIRAPNLRENVLAREINGKQPKFTRTFSYL